MEKVILARDTYDSVKAMLESPDEENMVVAFQCIENGDFVSNLAYILFLLKEADVEGQLWKEHAPETTKKLTTLFKVDLVNAPSITFKSIMRLMRLYKAPREDYQFFMDRYALHLVDQFNEGQEEKVIEHIEITLKAHPDESRTISQSLERLDA